VLGLLALRIGATDGLGTCTCCCGLLFLVVIVADLEPLAPLGLLRRVCFSWRRLKRSWRSAAAALLAGAATLSADTSCTRLLAIWPDCLFDDRLLDERLRPLSPCTRAHLLLDGKGIALALVAIWFDCLPDVAVWLATAAKSAWSFCLHFHSGNVHSVDPWRCWCARPLCERELLFEPNSFPELGGLLPFRLRFAELLEDERLLCCRGAGIA